jgi:hypothetical protein
LGAGTRANFAELNRSRPDVRTIDFAAYSVQPQEHATDNASLVETLAAQADTVGSARQFLGRCPLVIGPVTLKRRVNPYATAPQSAAPSEGLPPRVDLRQLSLLGATWTLGSLKYLAESQVSAVTYYETTGWLGVMERPEGSPQPDQFPSTAGGVFPLYFVLADAGEMRGSTVIPVRSPMPLIVEALLLRSAERTRLMVGNLTARPQRVCFETPQRRALVRILDETSAPEAILRPEVFRSSSETMSLNGSIDLPLAPFAYACVDLC